MKLLLLISAFLSAGFVYAQNPGSLPDSAKSYTILVMKAEQGIMQKKYNRELQEAFEKHYTGPFELVGKKDLESEKYADLSKYRYTVDYFKTGETIIRERDSKLPNHIIEHKTITVDIVFHDRLNNKDLNRPGIQTSTYIDALRQLGKMLEASTK